MIKFVRVASFLIAVVVTIFSIFFIDAEHELAQARSAYRSGDMDQALRKARRANRALSDDERKISAYYVQARAASKMEWTEKAKDYLDELLSLDPNNVSGLLFRGEIALQLRENETALHDLDKGIAQSKENIKPNDLAYSLSKRGLAHLALNQTDEAEADAKRALQLSVNLPEAHDLMSRVYENKGEIKNALAACERAYQLSIERNKLSFLTPEGRELSDRLVDLKVKALRVE
jgi:tetratricopeptide (TPR) repeat protein